MITLTFDPSKQQPPRKAAQSLDGIRLVPGRNTISPPDWQKLQAHDGFADLLEQGAVFMHELDPSHLVDAPGLSPEVVEVIDPTKSNAGLSGAAADDADDALNYAGLENLKDFTTEEAAPIIASTSDLSVLERWQAAETRKGVGELLSDRIAELEPPF